ncbi:hypothetical protein PHYSODRAFT_319490 [Phytophthora sojae]|uniref:CCHC-type domain-containing protein n=1 Tax=Phytophthora sojae (strain P6497) TaxID=1094619 RepID=G5ABE4_PHYSP|nr:hypothetical protein PHYSODRAFT_319490 [Phytophthora sojae]EGZ06669.1 hypothetical protein PHYSODRAFT_319490 [Phytophthora sojae]|eukprot:XP_009537433.1 hypothetical protein PHYSODRAFT_319490 [Phytophthora sojae]
MAVGQRGCLCLGLSSSCPRVCNKAPRFEGTFELYRAELELYLAERDLWAVVSGGETRHITDVDLQRQYDGRDRIARATILRGLRCQGLYQTSHNEGQLLAEYITTMTQLRQKLRNMGPDHAITDNDMAQLLLMGVAVTHPELLDHFDLPTRQGNPPTLLQVTNALRSKDERTRMAEQVGGTRNGNGVVMNTMRAGPPVQPGLNGGNGGKKRKCFHCGKPGHFKRDCWHLKKKSKKVQAGGKEIKKTTKLSKKKTEEKASKGDHAEKKPGVIQHMLWLNGSAPDVPGRGSTSDSSSDSDGDEEAPALGMVAGLAREGAVGAWMLDCGSTTHVCVERGQFSSSKKSKAMFKVWTGEVTLGVMSGSVLVTVANARTGCGNEDTVHIKMENVEYSPFGSVNLISLGRMEEAGWLPSFSPSSFVPRSNGSSS